MFDSIAPRYELVNRIMTFGLDAHWRRRTIALLEVAAGFDRARRRLRDRRPRPQASPRDGQRPLGIDLSLGMLAAARPGGAPADSRRDAAAMPVRTASADAVVSGFAVRNFADLPGVLSELGRVAAPGGRLALLEVGEPQHRLLRLGHRVWFTHVVPTLGALLSDGAAYRYLPRSVAYLPSLRRARATCSVTPVSPTSRHAAAQRWHRPVRHRHTSRRRSGHDPTGSPALSTPRRPDRGPRLLERCGRSRTSTGGSSSATASWSSASGRQQCSRCRAA